MDDHHHPPFVRRLFEGSRPLKGTDVGSDSEFDSDGEEAGGSGDSGSDASDSQSGSGAESDSDAEDAGPSGRQRIGMPHAKVVVASDGRVRRRAKCGSEVPAEHAPAMPLILSKFPKKLAGDAPVVEGHDGAAFESDDEEQGGAQPNSRSAGGHASGDTSSSDEDEEGTDGDDSDAEADGSDAERLMNTAAGSNDEAGSDDDDAGSDDSEGLGAGAQWKAGMLQRAKLLFSARGADLQSYIYGDTSGGDANGAEGELRVKCKMKCKTMRHTSATCLTVCDQQARVVVADSCDLIRSASVARAVCISSVHSVHSKFNSLHVLRCVCTLMSE